MKKTDLDDIVNIISDFREMVAGKFAEQDARFDSVDARFDSHDARFDSHDARFDNVDAHFDIIEKRLDSLEKEKAWVHDILEKQTTMLKNLDQERYFGVGRQDRLEAKIKTIEEHLKLAS